MARHTGPKSKKELFNEQRRTIVSEARVRGVLNELFATKQAIRRRYSTQLRLTKKKRFKKGQIVEVRDANVTGKIIAFDERGSVFLQIGKKKVWYSVHVLVERREKH